MSWAESERVLIPVYRGMPRMDRPTAKIDLLLAPDLYLMKREALPVRFAFEAKRIAPTILEELGAGEGWQVEALREDTSWLIIAYDPRLLGKILQEAGIPPTHVGRLYFAQQFHHQLVHPLLLEDGKSLISLGDTVALLPTRLGGGEESISLSQLSRPSQAFSLRGIQGRDILEHSIVMMFTGILILLGLAWSIEGWHFHRAAAELKKPLNQALEGHSALASSITRRNIHERYLRIDQTQRRLRIVLQRLGTLIGKEARLSHLFITPKSYEVRITATPQRIATLKKLALRQGFSPRIDGTALLLKGTLR